MASSDSTDTTTTVPRSTLMGVPLEVRRLILEDLLSVDRNVVTSPTPSTVPETSTPQGTSLAQVREQAILNEVRELARSRFRGLELGGIQLLRVSQPLYQEGLETLVSNRFIAVVAEIFAISRITLGLSYMRVDAVIRLHPSWQWNDRAARFDRAGDPSVHIRPEIALVFQRNSGPSRSASILIPLAALPAAVLVFGQFSRTTHTFCSTANLILRETHGRVTWGAINDDATVEAFQNELLVWTPGLYRRVMIAISANSNGVNGTPSALVVAATIFRQKLQDRVDAMPGRWSQTYDLDEARETRARLLEGAVDKMKENLNA